MIFLQCLFPLRFLLSNSVDLFSFSKVSNNFRNCRKLIFLGQKSFVGRIKQFFKINQRLQITATKGKNPIELTKDEYKRINDFKYEARKEESNLLGVREEQNKFVVEFRSRFSVNELAMEAKGEGR